MERTQSGLFALHITSLATDLSTEKPAGVYDPSEQLWKDEGAVLAWCGGPGARCEVNSDCCPIAGILSVCILGECILN
jgi:hypothetical protein